MSNLRTRNLRLVRILAAGLLAPALSATAAQADGSGILGAFLNVMGNALVLGSWQKVDADTQNCLASQFNMTPSDLAQQGVLATDPRVTPYIAQCQQMIAQAQAQSQQPFEQASIQQPATPADESQRRASLSGLYGKRDCDLIMQGQIGIGMRPEEVTLAWGDPGVKTPHGKLREIWSYGGDKVIFVRGKVSTVSR